MPLARASQVHGDEVVVVDAPVPLGQAPTADALVDRDPGLGLMVRVADCVPVVLADVEAGVVGAVHAGRPGHGPRRGHPRRRGDARAGGDPR